jgi:alkylation response protein AidB-like acyl-CoA dehydrogenase
MRSSPSIPIQLAGHRLCQRSRCLGQPIAAFQAIQWLLADAKTDLEAAALLTYRAAWLADRGERYTAEASMAKLFASEVATRVCNDALQIHGGYGFTREFEIPAGVTPLHPRRSVASTLRTGGARESTL